MFWIQVPVAFPPQRLQQEPENSSFTGSPVDQTRRIDQQKISRTAHVMVVPEQLSAQKRWQTISARGLS